MSTQLSLFPDLAQSTPPAATGKQAKPSATVLRQAVAAYLPTVNDLPQAERPRDLPEEYGSGALATDELLACAFGLTCHGHADAQHLLSAFERLPGLACATIHELQTHPGIGPARVAQVKTALELAGASWWQHPTSGRRFASRPAPRRRCPSLSTPWRSQTRGRTLTTGG